MAQYNQLVFACGGLLLKGDGSGPVDKAIITYYHDPTGITPDYRVELPVTNKVTGLMDRLSGLGGVSVLDATQVLTSFDGDLTGYSVLDNIAQTLLPSNVDPSGFLADRLAHRGLQAKFSNLRIHTASTTAQDMHFHRTNSSTPFFGKVIFCLPYAFKGGEIRISSYGKTITYSLGNIQRSGIYWIAFNHTSHPYITPVVEGCQIIIEYDLYIKEGTGSILQHHAMANALFHPFYHYVYSLLRNTTFLPNGGKAGLCLLGDYDHTRAGVATYLPYALRGFDMVAYQSFSSLGYRCVLKPIVADSFEERDDRDEPDDEDDEYQDDGKQVNNKWAKLGTELHELVTDAQLCDEDRFHERGTIRIHEEFQNSWPCTLVRDENIVWLNDNNFSPERPSMVSLFEGGGDPWTKCEHSSLVLLVDIPRYVDRRFQDIIGENNGGGIATFN